MTSSKGNDHPLRSILILQNISQLEISNILLWNVSLAILMVVILGHKLFQMCLFKACSLRLALWAQLMALESPIKIPQKLEQKYITDFGGLYA
ncbi:hypothetical protein [Clostridium chromiireducens]|uniref:hypothetical protein n=1 Tax=Clostridium chromiireducens TaxID=225345 RepID=UPI001365734E|nr:hypothetical protein [Clostridium chromiireducens]